MPKVLPTIPNTPPQGIQALLDKVYLWNPDAANNLIIRINELLKEIEEAGGAVASVNGQTGEVVLTAEDIKAMFAGEEESIQVAIDTLKTDQGELGDQVSSIEEKIPESASSTNQLVTKNEVLALPTFTYKVVQELPETGEEKIIYLVPKAGEGNDVHDEYIWVNGAYELIGTTAVDLSDYLPLSGGTLTGTLKSNVPYFTPSLELPGFSITRQTATRTTMSFGMCTLVGDVNTLRPYINNGTSFGSSEYKWANVFTTKLNNGADIAVPTTGGTLALAEDIAESVTTKDLTVGTDEGTLNLSITAGVATIATNNGLDIVSQTKFDTAPTTDDSTAWASVNPTALVTKQQVVEGLGEGGTTVTIRNWA